MTQRIRNGQKCAKPGCTSTVYSQGLDVCNRDVDYRLGISYQVLQAWVMAGYLHPIHEGTSGAPRTWPASELEIARTMGRLNAAGLSVKLAAQIARSGQRRTEVAPGIVIEVSEVAS